MADAPGAANSDVAGLALGRPELAPATVWSSSGCRCFGGAGESYAMEELLGEGGYGSVYRCRRSRDSVVLAAKIIDPRRVGFGGSGGGTVAVETMALREVDAMRRLAGHPGIVSLEAALQSEDTRQIFIVTEFVPGGDLFSHMIRRTEPFQESEAAHVLSQISAALAFCHRLSVVHRDLKLENVLVAGVHVRPAERSNAGAGGLSEWQTEELFTVKICDFGFAKALNGYNTKTPIGTELYSAPEVRQSYEGQTSGAGLAGAAFYDAFKADAYSLGVVAFALLCLGFPPHDGGEGSRAVQARWSRLSKEAHGLIDGLLQGCPSRRLSVAQACLHPWLAAEPPASADAWGAVPRPPQPRAGNTAAPVREPALAGVLALHRALVALQRERGMACWAISGSPGLDGVSCWDQFRLHAELTRKRLAGARSLLESSSSAIGCKCAAEAFGPSLAELENARQQVLAGEECASLAQFDAIFLAYNRACGALMEVAAQVLEDVRPKARRAARRYRLASAAAEQLGRERAFLCGNRWRIRAGPASADATGGTGSHAGAAGGLALLTLRRLAEIMGARKVLLGTVAAATSAMSSDIVTTSVGLAGALLGADRAEGDGEPPLLSAADIAELEAIEERMLDPNRRDTPATDELYRSLTRMLNEVHSRVVVGLLEDLRPAERGDDHRRQREQAAKPEERAQGCGCCCRKGVKKLLLALADKL